MSSNRQDLENQNPLINERVENRTKIEFDNGKLSIISKDTVFELIRDIKDPEHPHTLEELSVVSKEDIFIGELANLDIICQEGLPLKHVDVIFTPTVPHCSMAGIIGLCIKSQLDKYISGHLIRVYIKFGTHTNYIALNKQLNDKDRVMAALENDGLMEIISSCVNKLDF